MIVIQMIICLTIPIMMFVFGSTKRNGNVPYLKKGISYRIGRAKASEEAWTFANDLFFNMLRMSGINISLISFLFLVLVKWKYDEQLWVLCISLLVLEICAGLTFPLLFTHVMMKHTFDKNGVLLHLNEDHEENQEEETGDPDE